MSDTISNFEPIDDTFRIAALNVEATTVEPTLLARIGIEVMIIIINDSALIWTDRWLKLFTVCFALFTVQ